MRKCHCKCPRNWLIDSNLIIMKILTPLKKKSSNWKRRCMNSSRSNLRMLGGLILNGLNLLLVDKNQIFSSNNLFSTLQTLGRRSNNNNHLLDPLPRVLKELMVPTLDSKFTLPKEAPDKNSKEKGKFNNARWPG